MTNKLTKNDRLTVEKSISDLKVKNVQPNFDTIVAAFEAFLQKVGAHKSYFEEWAKVNNYIGTANVFYDWRIWAKYINYQAWIIDAFLWRGSQKGLDYWIEINGMWIDWLKLNIDK